MRAPVIALLLCTAVLGLAYPLAMTGVAQVLFPSAADGAPRLIGRDYSGDAGLFQGRPSATGYSADATFFNNLGPNQRDLAEQMRDNVAAYLEREGRYTPGLTPARVPADAATTSASGIDPHISPENAAIQANRVARERGVPLAVVRRLVEQHTSGGPLGPDAVNVVELNRVLGTR